MRISPIKSIRNKRILLSPLNWGLGHVARTIPIVQELLLGNNEVIICCDEHQESFYRHYFPSLWYVSLEGYPFHFEGKGRFEWDVLKHYRLLHKAVKKERSRVSTFIEKFNPDILISDQRFGFYSSTVRSIIISHQLDLPTSRWNVLGKWWNKRQLNRFDEIWIPDNEKRELSGSLSRGNFKNKVFIGIQSRFKTIEKKPELPSIYDYLCIISGPSPYHRQFFDLLFEKLSKTKKKCVFIVPFAVNTTNESDNLQVITPPSSDEFEQLLRYSNTIISRSGYSTLMDLEVLQLKAILIPTPGQSEQLYLAKLHKNHPLWTFMTEEEWRELE